MIPERRKSTKSDKTGCGGTLRRWSRTSRQRLAIEDFILRQAGMMVVNLRRLLQRQEFDNGLPRRSRRIGSRQTFSL